MEKLYKLTDENGRTHGDTQWGEGVSHSGTGKGDLCGPGWIHAYTHPLLAVLLNPIHADFKKPRLWEAKGVVKKKDRGLKVGCKKLTTVKEIPLPEVTTDHHVRFAILCAKEVCKDTSWNKWADDWLSGKDRPEPKKAAWAAEEIAEELGKARTAWAAEWSSWAARAAARSAWASEWAEWAAWAAWAARSAEGIDLIAIAEKAVMG